MYSVSEGFDELKESEEARQQIRAELRRLEEKVEKLTEEKGELEAKIPVLRQLLNNIQNVTSSIELEKMIEKGETGSVVRPGFFKTSKYIAEKDLQSRLKEREDRLVFVSAEIPRINAEIEREKICPDCQGQGVRRTTEFVREDNIVRSVLKTETCPLCEGSGKID